MIAVLISYFFLNPELCQLRHVQLEETKDGKERAGDSVLPQWLCAAGMRK